MVISLPLQVIVARRAALRCLDGRKIGAEDEAARYVDGRGFLPLFRLPNSPLPALSDADAGEWEGAWRWKETLPGARRCAYGKFLRGRGFFVAWRLFPAFCRVYGRSTDPAEDYERGLLGRREWAILQIIAERGPIDSRALWRDIKGQFGGNRHQFESALTSLQSSLRVMVAGGSLEGWSLHYWNLVERQAPPGLLARLPARDEAMAALLMQYVGNAVACTPREAAGFFGWDLDSVRALAARLITGGEIREAHVEGWEGGWLVPSDLGSA